MSMIATRVKNVGLLEREPLDKAGGPVSILSVPPVEYASEHLGYKHPEEEKRYRGNALARELVKIGIKPFTLKSVGQYKREQVGLRKYFPANLIMPAAGVIITAVISMLCGYTGVGYIGYILGFDVAGLMLGLAAAQLFSYESQPVWRTWPLGGYKRPVPKFALAAAQEIHQRFPKAEFMIEELVDEKIDYVQDPFLIAKYEDRLYYIEVWAEPGFEQERMA